MKAMILTGTRNFGHIYPVEEANKALTELKQQKIRGARVLKIN
jgi:hypothetical protein